MSELIAEARVLVTPDTTAFRAQLVTQLAAATKGVTVPIKVTPVAARATDISRELAASQATLTAGELELAGARDASAAASTKKTQAARLEAVAAHQLAIAQEEVLGTTTALGAAQTAAARSAAALATARRAESLLTREDTAETAHNTVVTLQNAEALNVEAQAAVRSAQAQAARSASLSQGARGAVAATLSFAGLRGATLAAGGAFLTGAAAVVAFGKALASATQFQTSLNVFAATAGATADEMRQVSEVSKRLGADLTLPGVTANSAADALSGLARAGLSVQQAIAGVRGVLQLATAAAIPNEDAVTLVANALNAFSLNGAKAAKIADLLAASSKESQGEITDVGLALQQSAAAAAQAGVSVEDTIALLTELGRAGLRGSDAGTSLRVALIRLIAPTKQAKEALDGLGVAIRDEQGNVRPEAFAEITAALSQFTKAQQDATLALIFGQDAFRAASIIGREGAGGLQEMRDATQEVGVAAELAAARTKGLAGSVENLKNQLSTAGLGIGQAFSTPLGDLVDIVAGGIGNLNSFLSWVDSVGNETPRAQQSVSDLADQFARLNREAGGTGNLDAAVQRVAELGRPAAIAVLDYADLTKELGKLSFALDSLREQGSSLDTPGARKLQQDILALIEALNETEPAGLKAADGIEAFRNQLTPAATELERLKHAIEQPSGFLPKAPVLPDLGPKAIGPDVTRQAKIQVAESRGDLQEVERLQEQVLADANTAVANGIHKNRDARIKLLQAQAAAQAALNQTRRQIQTEQEQADQKAQSEAERKAREFAQGFLAQQERLRNAQERTVTVAGDTKGLADDIRAQQGLRELITRQIAAIRRSALDEKTKQDAIDTLLTARQQTASSIAALIVSNREAREQARQEAFDAQVSLAEAQNNVSLQLTLINVRIRAINAQIAAGNTEGAALNKLKTEREKLTQQREDLQDQRRSDQEALGQSIFDLTGNKNPLLRALNAEIADTRADIAAARKLGRNTTQLQTELNGFLLKRKNLLEDAKGADDVVGGTTLVDLFNKAQDIVGQAGNTGFTAQSLAGLRAQPRIQAEVQQRLDIVNDPAAAAAAKQVAATDRLVLAIDQLTQVLTGNTASGTPITRREQNQWRDLTQAQRFYNQRTARQMVEQGLVG